MTSAERRLFLAGYYFLLPGGLYKAELFIPMILVGRLAGSLRRRCGKSFLRRNQWITAWVLEGFAVLAFFFGRSGWMRW